VLNEKYTGSSEVIKKGDSIYLEGEEWGGQVKEVCLPHTQLAQAYKCEKTGGILVLFDDGILALLPFGSDHCIKRRPAAETGDR
jgi:hypothetical protein